MGALGALALRRAVEETPRSRQSFVVTQNLTGNGGMGFSWMGMDGNGFETLKVIP